MSAQPSAAPWFAEALGDLVERRDLSAERMRVVMDGILGGSCGEAETAALLIAFRMKGEAAEELAAAAGVMRERMVRFDPQIDGVLDTCGTGGDGARTFNISTAAAFVAAGAGVPVVKHGNRAVSSQCGSADVLTALGVPLAGDPQACRSSLQRAGMAFCLAAHFHPALQKIGPLRRRLATRTIFNCLGPLANPASAPFQLIGVGRPEWLDTMAEALARLGTRRALLVHGRDGLDEVTLSTETLVREVRGDTIVPHEWQPADFGLESCSLEDLRVGTPEQSAAVIRSVLDGCEGPARQVVLGNAAAALLAAERVSSLREGVELASETIRTGRARGVLRRLVGDQVFLPAETNTTN